MMPDRTCKTCASWEKTDIHGHVFHNCGHPLVGDVSVCEESSGLETYENCGYRPQVMTGPDFGCIHWGSAEDDDGD